MLLIKSSVLSLKEKTTQYCLSYFKTARTSTNNLLWLTR